MNYDLNRFLDIEENEFQKALNEIINGKKTSHWMWYFFPQLQGLGTSEKSEYYGIKNIEEAIQFLKNKKLYGRIVKITQAVLNQRTSNISDVFDYPDDFKFHSSMTLFYFASKETLFKNAINKYFDGKFDVSTIELLKSRHL